MDLTDSSLNEEILHLASLAEVFGGFAHEIAQPLNAIMIASQVLQLKVERSLLTESEKSFLLQRLTIVTNQVQRASDIVDSLRGFSRRNGGHTGDCHAMSMVRRILGLMEQQFVMRAIDLDVDGAESMTGIVEDADTAERVLVQALAFARDFVSAIGSWHADQGIAYQKKLKIHFSQSDMGQVMSIAWNRGELSEGSELANTPMNIGLTVAAAVLASKGGSLLAQEDGLTIRFP
jgi:phosphoglycerate-specific signal transduction histidine kinase